MHLTPTALKVLIHVKTRFYHSIVVQSGLTTKTCSEISVNSEFVSLHCQLKFSIKFMSLCILSRTRLSQCLLLVNIVILKEN